MARSLSEPATRRIDAEQSQSLLAALRRLIQAAHVLRLDVQDDRPRPPLPELQPLAADTDAVLSKVEAALRARPDEQPPGPALPDLRARYLTFADLAPAGARREGLLAELDEIVDAANSLASVADLDGSSASEAGRTQAQDASVIHS